MSDYWYENSDRLNSGDICRLENGDVVKLIERVPGDGTKWRVMTMYYSFVDQGQMIESSDIAKGPAW